MKLARPFLFACLPGAALVACSGAHSPSASATDASADGAHSADDGGQGMDSAVDATGLANGEGTATLDVNGASYEISGDFLTGYGATSDFNESADDVIVNVQLQWSGTGVGAHPCTFALVYVFASTGLACDYEFETVRPVTGGTCAVTITSDGPNEGDLVVGTFAASLGPNPDDHNVASCPNPCTLSGSFSQPRPTSADAGATD